MLSQLVVLCVLLLVHADALPDEKQLYFHFMYSCISRKLVSQNLPVKARNALRRTAAAFVNYAEDWTPSDSITNEQFERYHRSIRRPMYGKHLLENAWRKCSGEACRPQTELHEVSCRTKTYFSYNPRLHQCRPQRGICERSFHHFNTMHQCELACKSIMNPPKAPKPLVLPRPVRRKKPGTKSMQLLLLEAPGHRGDRKVVFNHTVPVDPKEAFLFLAYFTGKQ
ncbi:uncharacterized protein LOC135383556 [Ornithodoros turicata]|uniref:uncharacterized protein LOC135383556 n=1 Tax=Ornithodoros turicata TaxID=34597 RepID=UPI003139FF2C